MGHPWHGRGHNGFRARTARHRMIIVGVVLAVIATACSPQAAEVDSADDAGEVTAPSSPAETTPPAAPSQSAGTDQPSEAGEDAQEVVRSGPPAWKGDLELIDTITGEISPKSVVASGDGLFLAQNMMYQHTVTAYDGDGELLATIPDKVDLAEYGFKKRTGGHSGAPVEAAFTPSGDHAYVSNYSMYGPGFGPEGSDSCTPASGVDHSYVYRIDTDTLEIDDVIKVGAVPKYVAVSPDGRWVLVTNWCTWDLSVIDAEKGKQVRRIEMGAYPRGIAIDPDSETAYIAIMGGSNIAAVDLDDFSVSSIDGVGAGPRDLRMDPNGKYLYATLNSEGRVAKIDLKTRKVKRKATAGQAPRSMAISDDGTALYVVNYNSDSVSKIRTKGMRTLQTLPTNHLPIGITYDSGSREVWVACYSGSIMRFEDGKK